MGKSKEIIVDSKQTKNKEQSETKSKKSKKDVDIIESDHVVETKKSKKDKVVEIQESVPLIEIKKETKKSKKDKIVEVIESVPVVEIKKETIKSKKDKIVEVIESVPVVETKKETKKSKKDLSTSTNPKNIIEDNTQSNDNTSILDTLIPKSSVITNPEFIILKNKWYELTKKIENLNNEKDILELEKNNFVSEMCKIIEKHQPKVENLLEQKTSTVGKATISSKLLENDSDDSSDSSDSDDEIPIQKKIPSKKLLVELSDDDSDSD